ncbi:MYND-type domain-containing protein [Mycena kentingensis (nom. inval.)]|nr:MYND-type domain-containing protein [Mycena kentingensis (nom. inval.)]
MHPSLRLERLPAHIRARALTAFSPSATYFDVDSILEYARTNCQVKNCLPIIYGLLDTSNIPSTGDFDPATQATGRLMLVHIPGVVGALQAMSLQQAYLGNAAPEIWVRVRPWLVFLFEYSSVLVDVLPMTSLRNQISLDCLLLCRCFLWSKELSTNVLDPEILSILACGWAALENISKTGHADYCPLMRSNFSLALQQCLFCHDAPIDGVVLLEALLNGIDGGLTRLAQLILFHLDAILDEFRASPNSDDPIQSFAGLINLILRVEPVFKDLNARHRHVTNLFLTLVRNGIVRILSTILSILVKRKAHSEICEFLRCQSQKNILYALSAIFSVPPGNLLLPEALDNHLLKSIIEIATGPNRYRQHEYINLLFRGVFMPFQLLELEGRLGSSDLAKGWMELAPLLSERIQLLKAFEESRAEPSLKVCSNLKCMAVQAKHTFKRCSGCMMFLYCSKKCQIEDWSNGGHREACSSHHETYLQKRQLGLTSRDYAYIRTIIDHDTQTSSTKLSAAASHFAREALRPAGGDTSVLVMVHLLGGNTLIARAYHPASTNEKDYIGPGPTAGCVPIVRKAYEDHVRRAAESKGRLAVDVVYLRPTGLSNVFPEEAMVFLVPAYSTRPILQEFRRWQADSEEGIEEVYQHVLSARRADEEFLEFHY